MKDLSLKLMPVLSKGLMPPAFQPLAASKLNEFGTFNLQYNSHNKPLIYTIYTVHYCMAKELFSCNGQNNIIWSLGS